MKNFTLLKLQVLSFFFLISSGSLLANDPQNSEVSGFSYIHSAGKVWLTWNTIKETNLSHFVLESSNDGKNFNEIAILFGKSNGNNEFTYQFTTNDNNNVFYRLKGVNNDQSSFLTPVQKVIKKGNDNSLVISTYPNPVTSQLNVSFPASWKKKKVTYELYSLSGQPVTRQEFNSSGNQERIDVSNVKPGYYVVTFGCEGKSVNQQIRIQ